MTNRRYDRQQRFDAIGAGGQHRIALARVVIVGVGALGSVVAELLARAGVGWLRIVDRDVVEWSNLQRQSLYTEEDAREGVAKVQAAARRLAAINSEITVEPLAADLSPQNAMSLVDGMDLIIDGTDNFETRFLINDVALESRIPWVHGGCVGASGQVFLFWPGKTLCLRCLVPSMPGAAEVATCEMAGVLGPATHLIGALQSMQALKWVVGGADGEVDHHLVTAELWEGRFRRLDTADLRTVDCPACSMGRREFLQEGAARPSPLVLCGRNAVQIPPQIGDAPLSLSTIAQAWRGLGEVRQSRFLVRLDLSPTRSITLFRDGRAVVEGTEDPAEARSLYARFVGT